MSWRDEPPKMWFGKYKGWTVSQVADHDPSYLHWAVNNTDRFKMPEGMELPDLPPRHGWRLSYSDIDFRDRKF